MYLISNPHDNITTAIVMYGTMCFEIVPGHATSFTNKLRIVQSHYPRLDFYCGTMKTLARPRQFIHVRRCRAQVVAFVLSWVVSIVVGAASFSRYSDPLRAVS